MKITLDSNVWEKIFGDENEYNSKIRAAFSLGKLKGYVSDSTLRIESIRKCDRIGYFAQPHMEVLARINPVADGTISLSMSIGPNHSKHPGLPIVQSEKFAIAKVDRIQILRGISWMGLPAPLELRESAAYVHELPEEANEREKLQIEVFNAIRERGVGRAAFDAQGGWDLRPDAFPNAKKFSIACAEWADAELVAAHVGYRVDVICTNDRAASSRNSIFSVENRAWLFDKYSVRFMDINELQDLCA